MKSSKLIPISHPAAVAGADAADAADAAADADAADAAASGGQAIATTPLPLPRSELKAAEAVTEASSSHPTPSLLCVSGLVLYTRANTEHR